MTATVTVSQTRIIIEFPYDPALVEQVRTLPGRRFDRDRKCWTAPAARSDELAAFIETSGATVIDPDGVLDAPAEFVMPDVDKADVPGTAAGDLRAHQAQVVAAVQDGRRSILLADEPGLGKTATSIISAVAAGAQRVLVVAPAIMRTTWGREVERWAPGTSVQTVTTGKQVVSDDDGFVVINYDLLSAQVGALTAWRPDALILDEVHYIKNSKSSRTKAALAIARSMHPKSLRMGLSGTPVPKSVIDLAMPLAALGWLNDFGGWRGFADRYCDAHEGQWGLDVSGASNLEELHDRLVVAGMVRRVKNDVADLPDRSVVDVPVTLAGEEMRAIKAAVTDVVAAVVDTLRGMRVDPTNEDAVRKAIGEAVRTANASDWATVTQAVGLAKVAPALEQAANLLDAGEQVVVFAHHRAVQEALVDGLRAAGVETVRVTGGQSDTDRTAAMDAFQAGAARAVVASITAAGVGVTLTAASNVVLAEMPWTAAVQDQAIDRVHRIGQGRPVTAWRVVATGTVDDDQLARIASRAATSAAAIDGAELEEAETPTSAAATFLLPLVLRALEWQAR